MTGWSQILGFYFRGQVIFNRRLNFGLSLDAIGGSASVLVSVSAAPSLTHEQIQLPTE